MAAQLPAGDLTAEKIWQQAPITVRCRRLIGEKIHYAVVSALLLYAALHPRGMPIISECHDGWAYWQGAISIASGDGYRDFFGDPIIYWPPAYSTYLAFWTLIFGPTALAMVIGNALLVGAQAALWCHLSAITRPIGQLRLATPIAVYLGGFAALEHQTIFAHNLLDTLIPALLIAVWHAVDGSGRGTLRWGIAATVLATLCTLTHNSAIAFTGAAAGAALITRQTPSPRRLTLAAALVSIPSAAWLFDRLLLSQTGSHKFGVGAGYFPAGDYLAQLGHGLGALLTFDHYYAPEIILAILIILIFIASSNAKNQASCGFLLMFFFSATVMLYLLFNLTTLPNQQLNGRFLAFVPPLLMPLLVRTLGSRYPIAALALASAIILPVLYWSSQWVHFRAKAELSDQAFPVGFVPYNARVDPTMPLETAAKSDGVWRVGVCDWWHRKSP